MGYYELPDTHFVNIEVNRLMDEATAALEERLGKKLYPGSPERLILITLMEQIIQNLTFTDDVGRMNLLRHSRGDYLDQLAAFWGEYRVMAQSAQCTMRFTQSVALDYVNVIPSGTRVKTQDGRVFQTREPAEIPEGTTTKDVVVYAMEPGINSNNIVAGQITTIVDVFPFYQSCVNITATSGGMNREGDENFRERIHESPEKLSTAGPDLAYKYWTKAVDANIGDVHVSSPAPGTVKIVPLYRDGSIPGQEVLDKIKNDGITRDRRPLTDKVEVSAPAEITKSGVTISYWMDKINESRLSSIQLQVAAALQRYVAWQTSALGRDIVPDKLIEFMISAGAKRVTITGLSFETVAADSVVRIDNPVLEFEGTEEG